MEIETTDTPSEVEDTVEETTLDTELEPEVDEDGNPIEEEEEEEEIDLDDDLKLKVPKTAAQKLKELKEGSLRQADYTRKTQELAEQRKAFDAERNTVYQSTQEELQAYATAQSLAQQLASYQRVDWNAWEDQDPFEAQKGWRTFQQMKDAHQGAINKLSFLAQQRQAAAQQESAKRIGEGRQALEHEIGWNDELKAKLTDYALGMGLSRDDLSDLEATPAAAKILRDAYEWGQHQKKQQAAKRHETAQQAQPAAKAGGGTNPVPPSKLDDRLAADEWMRRRNKQVRERA